MDREIEKYLQSVRKAVNCSPASKAEVLEELKTDILLYTEENNVKDISEIVQRFGSPEKIAKSFLEESDVKIVNRAFKKYRWVAVFVLIIIVVAALVVAAINTYDLERTEWFKKKYPMETTISSSRIGEDKLYSDVEGIDLSVNLSMKIFLGTAW